jgi:carbonic anhydrase/acetyltransferase-like protein (isoleucine patch superfamily)
MRAARIDEGAVIGDECLIEEEALISGGAKGVPVQDDRGRRGGQHQR